MNTNKHECQTTEHKTLYFIAISVCLLIFVALRARWIGHLLTWDEAMNLCAVRALATYSHDHFSNWFWRHPPLFPMLMLLLHPLKQGFAERTEIMCIVIGIINLSMLYLLNKKIFGKLTALLSIFFLAIMPGSVFFDVWIKRDHTVATFGLLALLLLVNRRPLYAGLSLGLAFLSKETAIFYAGTAGLLWVFGILDKRTLKNFLVPTVVTILTCIWWYQLANIIPEPTISTEPAETAQWFDRIAGSATQHLKLAFNTESGWAEPWHYYLTLAPLLLGLAGTVAAILGTIVLCFSQTPQSSQISGLRFQVSALDSSPARLWPLFAVVPSLLALSVLPSKVPWIMMSIFPAWASLQGIAVAFLLRTAFSQKNCSAFFAHTLSILAVLTASGFLILPLSHTCRQSYDEQLRLVVPEQQRGAEYSKEAATAMNMATRNNHRVLIMSFHYWKGILPGQACPVFAYYYTGNAEIIMKPHQTSFIDIRAAINTYHIDWALLSPSPGKAENELFDGFTKTLNLRPIKLRQAWLFKTKIQQPSASTDDTNTNRINTSFSPPSVAEGNGS